MLQNSIEYHINAVRTVLNFISKNTTLYKICFFYLKICQFFIRKMIIDSTKVQGQTVSSNFTLDVIPLNIFKKLTKHITLKCDKEKCVLMSDKTWMQIETNSEENKTKDNICGAWVTILIENEMSDRFKRTVQVITDENMPEKQVLISDENMFNIIHAQLVSNNEMSGQDNPWNIINNSLKYMTSKFKVISFTLNDNITQTISHVYLEYINSFHSLLKNECLTKLVNNYFKYPRYHHLNDVIRINLKEYNLDIFQTDEINHLSDMKFVYLKICDIKTATQILLEEHVKNLDSGNETSDDRKQDVGTVAKKEEIHTKVVVANGGKTPLKVNVYSLLLEFIKKISQLLKHNQHGFYITTAHTSIAIRDQVQSCIPNIVTVGSTNLTRVDVNNYNKYIVNSYNNCSYFEKLLKCVSVFHSGRNKSLLNIEMYQIFLLTGSHSAGLHDLTRAVAEISGVHIKQVDCIALIGSVPTILEKNLDNLFDKAMKCAPCMLVFHNIEDICVDHAGVVDTRGMQHFIQRLSELSTSTSPAVVVCTSAKPDKIHYQIKRQFLKTIDVLPPTETERHDLISHQLSLVAGDYDLETALVDYLSASTAGFERHDLLCLVRLSVKNKSLQGQSDRTVNKEDFMAVHAELQSRYSDRLDAPSVPNVSWDDIGGLSKLKDEILSTFRAVKRNSGLKRSGLLLHGPPGTGKTLIAKAVATECRMNFLAVKGPELLNKYVGQSEENIRNVFIRARSAAPCVVFFDELDSLAPRRGQEDQSSGVMDRVVSQLLAEMDGVHASKDVFILAATNRIDLLDPAILRPGRFDKSLCVGLYEDRSSQLGVLKAVVRKFQLADDVTLDSLVEHFPSQASGADIYSICSEAWTQAVRRIITESPHDKQARVMVRMKDFLAACPPVQEAVPVEDGPVETTPEIEVA